MKLRHKALVLVVYPKAVCVRTKEAMHPFTVYDKVYGGRELGSAFSAWGAWADTYKKFSTAQKRKAQA